MKAIKKIKFLIPVLFVSLIFIFASCEKKEILFKEPSILDEMYGVEIQQIDSYKFLKFKNRYYFQQFINNYDFENQKIKSFYSLYDYYQDIEKKFSETYNLKPTDIRNSLIFIDKDSVLEMDIGDNLAKCLNPDGIFSIGDTLFKLERTKLKYIKIKDDIKLSLEQLNGNGQNVEILSLDNNSKYSDSYEYKTNGDNLGSKKIKVKKWYRNYGYYCTIGGKIKYFKRSRKKVFGRWYYYWQLIKAKKLEMTITWDQTKLILEAEPDNIEIIDGSGSFSKTIYNKKYVSKSIVYFGGNIKILSFSVKGLKNHYKTPIKNGVF